MINLGEKSSSDEVYPSSDKNDKETINYPSITLPLKILSDAESDFLDEVTVVLKGKITRVEKSKWSQDFTLECHMGEVKTTSDDEDEKSLMG